MFTTYLRKFHLVLGLLMAPFALLYGISAFFFNHPSGVQKASFELNENLKNLLPPPLELLESTGFKPNNIEAVYYQKRLSLKNDSSETVVFFDDEGKYQESFIFEKDKKQKSEAILALEEDPLEKKVLEALSKANLGLKLEDLPELFIKTKDGSYIYNPQKKDIVRYERPAFGFTTLIQKMHKTHERIGPVFRIIWTYTLDLMAFTLIFWAVSGILMWLQLRKMRVLGLRVLLGTLVLGGTAFGSLIYYLLSKTT